jgi:hypothetical protein
VLNPIGEGLCRIYNWGPEALFQGGPATLFSPTNGTRPAVVEAVKKPLRTGLPAAETARAQEAQPVTGVRSARFLGQPAGQGGRLVLCHRNNRGLWGRLRESFVEPRMDPKFGLTQRNPSRAGTSL